MSRVADDVRGARIAVNTIIAASRTPALFPELKLADELLDELHGAYVAAREVLDEHDACAVVLA